MTTLTPDEEELAVFFHAALLGRTDILTKVINGVRGKPSTAEEVQAFVSRTRPDDGCTALHIAAGCGHSDVVRALLQAGIDVSIIAKAGDYANKKAYEVASDATKKTFHVSLFEQVALGNIPNIVKLVNGGVPIDVKDGSKSNDSPIHWASSFGNTEVVEQLIANGCNFNIQNDLGQTAFHYACKANNENLVKLLLNEDADITILDKDGKKGEELGKPEIVSIITSREPPTCYWTGLYRLKCQTTAAELDTSNEATNISETKDESVAESHTIDNRFAALSDILEGKSLAPKAPERPLLVLWPPPQRQTFLPGSNFELKTNSNLHICVADPQIDIFPLLVWSGLMDTLDRLGFQSQPKRSIQGSRIRLSIDNYICPGHQRYEIVVTADRVNITASDSKALLYAAQTFVQIIQLQSLIRSQGGVTTVTIPAMEIHDWPDVPTRGILWCYRGNARMIPSQMRESVEMLSKLRINMIFLVIDTEDAASRKTDSNHETSPTTKIYAIDEVCRRHHIDLIPTVIISSIKRSLPTEATKNFSQSMISVYFLFDFDSILSELKSNKSIADVITQNDVVSAAYDSCERLLTELQAVGFRTVMITCSQWVNDHVDPSSIATRLGLHLYRKSLNELIPAKLFLRPIVAMHQYVETVISYVQDVIRNSANLSVIPGFIDNDFLYPSLLTKFYCFLYGGLAWNQSSGADILQLNMRLVSSAAGAQMVECQYSVPDDFGYHIKQALKFILFGTSKTSSGSSIEAVGSMLMDILSGKIYSYIDPNDPSHLSQPSSILSMSSFFFPSYVSQSQVSSTIPISTDTDKNETSARASLFSTEIRLWPLTTSPSYVSNGTIPTKSDLSTCLRVYRRIVNTASWKPTLGASKLGADAMDNGASIRTVKLLAGLENINHALDVEEYLAVIHLFSVITKGIIFSYNIHEKSQAKKTSMDSNVTLKSLIKLLPPGTKSDVANSLLETIEHLSIIWRKKYDRINCSSSIIPNVVDDWILNQFQNAADISDDQVMAYTRAKFFLQSNNSSLIHIPASPIFHLMAEGLMMPKSMEDVLKQLFE